METEQIPQDEEFSKHLKHLDTLLRTSGFTAKERKKLLSEIRTTEAVEEAFQLIRVMPRSLEGITDAVRLAGLLYR